MDFLVRFFEYPDLERFLNDAPDLSVSGSFLTEPEANKRFKSLIDEIIEECKSNEKSKQHRITGNELFKRTKYPDAFVEYNNSLRYACRDSEEYGLALANRSACLFAMEKYDECLNDIDMIMRTEYPLILMYKVILRQAECYIKKKLFSKAQESLKTAEEYFNFSKQKMAKIQIVKVRENFVNIRATIKTSLKNGEGKHVEQTSFLEFPKLEAGENPNYLNASSLIEITKQDRGESRIVAHKQIKKGSVLLVEEAYTCIPTDDNYCFHCLKECYCIVPCVSCVKTVYCSENCREQSWNFVHKYVCCAIRKNFPAREPLFALNILLKGAINGLQSDVDGTVFGNKDDNYPYLKSLPIERGNQFLLESKINSIMSVLYLVHYTDFFQTFYMNRKRPNGTKVQMYVVVAKLLMKHYIQMTLNKRFMYEYDVQRNISETRGGGMGMFVSLSLIKHSCLPNTTQSCENNVVVVRAMRDINKGEEITVSYFPIYVESREIMGLRSKFKDMYALVCDCERCYNFYKIDIFQCKRCEGPAVLVNNISETARCEDCSHVFGVVKGMKYLQKSIMQLENIYELDFTDDNKVLLIRKIMKTFENIFYKYNLLSLKAECIYMQNYLKKGDLENTIKSCRYMKDSSKFLFGNESVDHLKALTDLICALCAYSRKLKAETCDFRTLETVVKELNELLQILKPILQLHFAKVINDIKLEDDDDFKIKIS